MNRSSSLIPALRLTLVAAIAGVSLSAPTIALAQDEVDAETGRAVKFKERTEIDFDALDVTGELVKPQSKLVTEPVRAKFNPLIQFRLEFNDEIKRSVNEVK